MRLYVSQWRVRVAFLSIGFSALFGSLTWGYQWYSAGDASAAVFAEDWCRDDWSSAPPSVPSLSPANSSSCAATFTGLTLVDGSQRRSLAGYALPRVATLQSAGPIPIQSGSFSIEGTSSWTNSSCIDVFGNRVTNIRVHPDGPGAGFVNFNTADVGGSFHNFRTRVFGPYTPGIHSVKASMIIGHGVDPATGRGRGSCDVAIYEFSISVAAPMAPSQTPVISAAPTTTPIPTPIVPQGRIQGACTWVNDRPQVTLQWSQVAPIGVVTSSNELQKGDCTPSDPNTYWCAISAAPGVYQYVDTSVQSNTQYQYRAKYRAETPTTNTYNIYTSAENCGGPLSTPGPLTLTPQFQSVSPNVSALFTAAGGDGAYVWSAEGGTLGGSGNSVGISFTNGDTASVMRQVTVMSGGQTATAAVRVDGVSTYQDAITLVSSGARFVRMNDDAAFTTIPVVSLTLGHGFTGVSSSSVLVRLGNSEVEARSASPVAFSKTRPWNICPALDCTGGLRTVYAIYEAPGGVQEPITFDSIAYVPVGVSETAPAALINRGALATDTRTVSLELWHGFIDVPDVGVTMRIANTLAGVADAAKIPFTSTMNGWDLCQGATPACPNGVRPVYVEFCHGTTCQVVVHDDIELVSAWPAWGVQINDDAATTDTNLVQLQLHPWFADSKTIVWVSDTPDFARVASYAYAPTISWDICAYGTSCMTSDYSVYVRYENVGIGTWPSALSPGYSDAIRFMACEMRPICLDASPACHALPPPEGWCPAGTEPTPKILINEGDSTTSSRTVRLAFAPPFSGESITMRPVNEHQLSVRDRAMLERDYGGGAPSQPRGVILTVSSPVSGAMQQATPDRVSYYAAELESGTVRVFSSAVSEWDLCESAAICVPGEYRVYVQYYQPSSAANGVRAAMGDVVSSVFYDTITLAAVTPTPTPSGTPLPTGSATPNPDASPTGDPSISPGGTPSVSGTILPPGTPVTSPLIGGVEDVQAVVAPVSIAVAAVVAVSAIAALSSVASVSGFAAFAWQGFLGLLGLLPARKKVWGTVYDARTKRPIPYARVQLLDRNRRVLETHIADTNGRYGFLTTPESLHASGVQIQLMPAAKNYSFPAITPPSIDSFVYSNLYKGELVSVDDKTLINFDIPMEPMLPARAPLVSSSPSILLGATVAATADAGFWLGLILVPLNFVLVPNPFTFGVLCLFLGTASLRLFGISEHPFGTVRDQTTGQPMPFALMTLNDMTGKRVAFAVSDEQGRYFLVVERGMYQMEIFTSATVQPARRATQTIDARKGWITKAITL